MTGFAVFLILIAAFVHATWNFLAKRVGGGPEFVWLFTTLAVLMYLPLALFIIFVQQPHFSKMTFVFMLGSMAIHLVYFLLLQQGYRRGDLSLVYPLARGTGPTLSTIAAILFLGEQPTIIALIGAAFVIGGVFILTGGVRFLTKHGAKQSILFGLLTGLTIASYTLWDKYAVSVILIPPLLLEYSSSLGRVVLLSSYARRHWTEVRAIWQTHRLATLVVACFNSLAYILVLTAMTFTPVSYIAPARELSVLIVVLMGTGLLKEGEQQRRLWAAGVIVLGVITLALG